MELLADAQVANRRKTATCFAVFASDRSFFTSSALLASQIIFCTPHLQYSTVPYRMEEGSLQLKTLAEKVRQCSRDVVCCFITETRSSSTALASGMAVGIDHAEIILSFISDTWGKECVRHETSGSPRKLICCCLRLQYSE